MGMSVNYIYFCHQYITYMLLNNTNILSAKPFLKWAGGKTQLLKDIDNRLPILLLT